jgi:hypothetical protein
MKDRNVKQVLMEKGTSRRGKLNREDETG